MSQVQETVRFPLDIPGYSVVRELGQGGMSRVYLARAERLGGAVALKILDVERAGGLDARQRFHREVETVQRIRHPHVVRILDVGTVQGDPYIAMEYLPLGLKEWIQGIQKGRSGQAAQALIITAMLAEALFCAHQKGIIHRDVKPENILFRETGEPVLCDFGIAKVMEGAHHLTRTGVLIGTPLYMSPEQVRGGKVDTRSDLYSLGVVLYEMLVGHPPYRAEDQIAVALQHVQAPLPELPDELLHLQPLMRCALAKDPDRRWSDGREMANALRAAAADYPDVPGETVILSAGSLYVLPEHAADHKKSRFAQRWNGRWGLWLAGMLALGILVSGLLAAWGRYRENRSWDLAQSAQTPAAVLAYLNRYPDGKWALEAQTWMNRWRTDQGESAREGAEAQPVGQEKNDRGEAEHPPEEIKAGQKPPVLPPSGAGRSVKKREEPMPQGGLSERALSLPEV